MSNSFQLLDINQCFLDKSQLDIWQYSLNNLPPETLHWLSEDEVTRGNRYHFDRHRRRFRVARTTMRWILARYLNCPPQTLVFRYNKQGKPELANDPHLQFNLSHSRDQALLTVGYEHPLGIDIEYFSGRPYLGIAQHLFSQREIEAVHNAPLRLQPLIFFTIWTQKEALIKACGLGLSYPTKQFDVATLPWSHQEVEDTLHRQRWHMSCFMPEVACCAAVCFNPSIQIKRYIKLQHAFLL